MKRLSRLRRHLCTATAAPTGLHKVAATAQAEPRVLVSDGLIGGHIHPSLCVTPGGDLIAVFNRGPGDADQLLLTRSCDGGLAWSDPAVIPHSVRRCENGVYPGALTVLRSGEILLHWHRYGPTPERKWEFGPEFCVSVDDGQTFSAPHLIDIPLHPEGQHTQPEGRYPFLEIDSDTWVLPQYDRTVAYSRSTGTVTAWGDGRNHGMVPLVMTPTGALISGAPQDHAPVPVGPPDASGKMAHGLRSVDGGQSWQPLHQLGHFGVCGYDLTVLANGWVVHTAVMYGIGRDGEYSYELWLSQDDGLTFDKSNAAVIYSPGRRIEGRGWPRTVQLDEETVGTLFYDLTEEGGGSSEAVPGGQAGGPSLWFQRTKISSMLPGTKPCR